MLAVKSDACKRNAGNGSGVQLGSRAHRFIQLGRDNNIILRFIDIWINTRRMFSNLNLQELSTQLLATLSIALHFSRA